MTGEVVSVSSQHLSHASCCRRTSSMNASVTSHRDPVPAGL